MIVGGAQCREAAPNCLTDIPLVPDDEIGYLQRVKDRKHGLAMGDRVGRSVTDVAAIGYDHKAR